MNFLLPWQYLKDFEQINDQSFFLDITINFGSEV